MAECCAASASDQPTGRAQSERSLVLENAQNNIGGLSPRLLPLLIVALLAGALVFVACSGDDDPQQQSVTEQAQEPQQDQAASDPAEDRQQQTVATAAPASEQQQEQTRARVAGLEGEIAVDGSSTVFPITEAMAEEFGILTDRDVRVTVGVSGTGGGFKRFCAGETDISDASRPIKDSEVELCAEAGIDFIEVPVAFDGLTVVINPDNDWVDYLTVDELNHIFRPDDYAVSWAECPRWLPGSGDCAVRAGRGQRHVRLLHRGDQRGRRRAPIGQHDVLGRMTTCWSRASPPIAAGSATSDLVTTPTTPTRSRPSRS